jgi:hypothetical protein
MLADKSLFAARQPPDNDAMDRTPPYRVTYPQWLAVLAVWGLVAYGVLASPQAEARRDQVHLIACR